MNDNDMIELITKNNKTFINFEESKSNINEVCIIDSVKMLKHLKNKKIIQVPSSTVYKIYLYIDNNSFKWILKYLNGKFEIYRYIQKKE